MKRVWEKTDAMRIMLENKTALNLVRFAEIALLKKKTSLYSYNFPSQIQIEVTNRCNLKCLWCSHNSPDLNTHGTGDMDFSKLLDLLPQLKRAGCINLFGEGEPLLYPQLTEAIREARKYVRHVAVTTNATLLFGELSRDLASSGLTELVVSVDSADSETFKQIRGIALDKVFSNMTEFAAVSSVPLSVRAVVARENAQSLIALPKLLTKIPNCKKLYLLAMHESQGSDAAGYHHPVAADTEAVVKEISSECRKHGIRTDALELLANRKYAHGICKAPFIGMAYVNWRGWLTPCCSYLDLNLGNVFEKGFSRCWNGTLMRNFRKAMLLNKAPLHCKKWCGISTNAISTASGFHAL